MLGLPSWVSLVAVLLAAAAGRLLPMTGAGAVRGALQSRWAAAIVGVLTASVTFWVWGSLARTPVLHDESAYLLQAELFARGRWSGSAPPLPEFFRQLYVLVDPVLASKYPPGHSLVLALGALVRAPALPVLLMNGASGALVWSLARRAGGPLVSLLTWLVWMTSFPAVYYHANYMSEGTTSFTWLLAWWGLIRWREARDGDAARRAVCLACGAVAWCAITRPLTGLALGIVVGAVVLRRIWVRRAWRELVPASAVCAVILALVPLWNWRTTGDATLAPLTLYTRTYLPFDKPGFGVEAGAKPSPKLPRDQWLTSAAFYQEHARHTAAALPAIARERLAMIAHDAWYEWRGGLQLFAALGVLMLPLDGVLVLAAFALQFLLYLAYAHPARWTIYYVEGAPLLAFITALGIVRLFAWVAADRRVESPALRQTGRARAWWTRLRVPVEGAASAHRLAVAAAVVTVAAAAAAVKVTRQVRAQIDADHAYHEAFASLLDSIPERRAVVFVRYGPQHLDGLSLVRNAAALEDAHVWTVYDRGGQNARLVLRAPGRTPYVFDETSWTLRRLQRAGDSTRTSGVAVDAIPVASTTRR